MTFFRAPEDISAERGRGRMNLEKLRVGTLRV